MKGNINNITKESFKKIISVIFFVCLGLIIFNDIFVHDFFGFNLKSYYFFNMILSNIEVIKYGLITYAAVFGTLLLYLNKDKIRDLELDNKKELQEEEKRKKEFAENFPKLNKIPVLKSIVKWMYKEGWFYTIGLFLIIIFGFLLKYYLSMHLSPENDETYTYMVVEGYNKLKQMGLTPSGEMYDNTHKVFNYSTTFFYNYFFNNGFNKLFALRSFNIILGSLLTLPLYLFIKKLTNKKVAFLSILLFTFNWYLLITFITARPYVLFSIFSIITSILLIFGFNEYIENKKRAKKSLIYLVSGLVLGFINFYEGHILGLYHNIFLIIILLFYILFKIRFKKAIKVVGLGLLLGLLFLLFLYFFKPTFLEFIINTFIPSLNLTYLTIAYNQFSYFTEFGLLIILLIISYIFIYKNNIYKILAIYLIFGAILFHTYLFGNRLNSFKYLVDFLIILIIFFSIFIISFNNKKIKITLLLLFLFTNIYGIQKVSNDELTVYVFYNENSLKEFNLCKNYNVIATDSPGRAFLAFGKNKYIYSLPSFNDSYHFNNEKYLYLDIYAIKNIEHLKNIIKNKGSVCFVFSHNMFDDTGKFGNKKMFDYVIYNGKKIKEKNLIYRPFGTGKYPFTNKNNGVVLVVDNSIFYKKSQ